MDTASGTETSRDIMDSEHADARVNIVKSRTGPAEGTFKHPAVPHTLHRVSKLGLTDYVPWPEDAQFPPGTCFLL